MVIFRSSNRNKRRGFHNLFVFNRLLHKELAADDGEVTHTQKVRRDFVSERYAALIRALYDGSVEADISTEVTFEDGRKGITSARIKIRDVETVRPVRPAEKAA